MATPASQIGETGGEVVATTETGDSRDEEKQEWVCVGHESTYGARTKIKVYDRLITIIRTKNRFHAIDTICYHAGGPLTEGQLKSVGGRICLQCPWHSYLIDIESGEGLYMDLNRRYQSKGVRQRIHEVEIRDEHVWVRLFCDGVVASDDYAFGRVGPVVEVPSFPDG